MPMSARITNFAGGIVAEKRGGASQAFRHDPLGSTIAVISDAGTRTATYNYWPYGEVRSSTGSATTPWKFCGRWGYYEGKDTTTYVRARVLKRDLARWMTVDPLWPLQLAFAYAALSPVLRFDQSGLFPDWIGCGPDKKGLDKCCKNSAKLSDKTTREKIKACMTKSSWGVPAFGNGATVDFFLDLISRLCSKGGTDNRVCVRCAAGDSIPKWPAGCANPCKQGFWGYAFPPDGNELPEGQCGLTVIGSDCPGAHYGTNNAPCPCSIVMCESAFSNGLQSACAIFFHELAHCSALGHAGGEQLPPGVKTDRELDFIYKLGCCICVVLNGPGNCGVECDRVK